MSVSRFFLHCQHSVRTGYSGTVATDLHAAFFVFYGENCSKRKLMMQLQMCAQKNCGENTKSFISSFLLLVFVFLGSLYLAQLRSKEQLARNGTNNWVACPAATVNEVTAVSLQTCDLRERLDSWIFARCWLKPFFHDNLLLCKKGFWEIAWQALGRGGQMRRFCQKVKFSSCQSCFGAAELGWVNSCPAAD